MSAASIIRECQGRGKGVQTPDGQGVWLDTPMIELRNGAGTIERRIPAMLRMFGKYGMDIRKTPFWFIPPFTIKMAAWTSADARRRPCPTFM